MLSALLFSGLVLAAAPAKPKNDYSRCNHLAGHAGLAPIPRADEKPYYVIGADGHLSIDRDHPQIALVSSQRGEKKDTAELYEYADPQFLRVGQGYGEKGVLRVKLTLHRKDGHPVSLETADAWYPLDATKAWDELRRKLRTGALKPKASDRTRVTEGWIDYGFSAGRCFVVQEGKLLHGKKHVSFDQALCNQVLRLTDRVPEDVLRDYREGPVPLKREANRVLRLIRDAQIARDEALKGKGQRLLAAEETPPEQQLPGVLPPEDSGALQELRACIAAQARNGLARPPMSREIDDMFSEPQSGVLEEPSAAGLPRPADSE